MRNCTIELDGKMVVDRGRLCDELRVLMADPYITFDNVGVAYGSEMIFENLSFSVQCRRVSVLAWSERLRQVDYLAADVRLARAACRDASASAAAARRGLRGLRLRLSVAPARELAQRLAECHARLRTCAMDAINRAQSEARAGELLSLVGLSRDATSAPAIFPAGNASASPLRARSTSIHARS